MTAGMREELERRTKQREEPRSVSEGGDYDVRQKMMSYLRDKYTPESAMDAGTEAERLLVLVGLDWQLRHGIRPDREACFSEARSALEDFTCSDCGEALRGKGNRFGKIST